MASVDNETARLTRPELLQRALDLIPTLKDRAARTESLRQIPAENVQALRDSGLLRLAVPTRFGGIDGVRTNWYHDTLAGGKNWSDPLFGTASAEYIAPYLAPFQATDPDTGEQTPAGVVFANFSLNQVKSLLDSLELGRTGHAFIISRDGLYLAHPDEAYVLDYQNIFQVAERHNDPALGSAARRAVQGESGLLDYQDPDTGQTSWLFYEPIPATSWSLVDIYFKDEVQRDDTAARRRLIWAGVGALVLLLSVAALVFRPRAGRHASLWGLALTASLLAVALILYVWTLTVRAATQEDASEAVVLSAAGVQKFLAPYDAHLRERYGSEPVHVPTGVFVQSVEFTSSNNVVVTGYLWQKYEESLPEWVSRGFILPEAVEQPEITEVYRTEDDGVIGWSFRATLRQQFDYSKYPFDRETVWLRLWHRDFERNVVLVPDLASYGEVNPALLPGLAHQDFVLEGWVADRSYFSYRLNRFNTNFGMADFTIEGDIPELYFNLGITRNFINPFISNLLPVGIVVFLLFTVLLISTRNEAKNTLLGFNTANVLAFAAALFFVLILGHIDLRSKLNAQSIIYLEYFFFVMYFTILAVSVNAILLVSAPNIGMIQRQDNLIPKLLYWPVILGVLLVITVVVFY